MGINFPSAPTVGDLYPVPIVPGIPQYKWDGNSWLVVIQDTQAYVRRAGDSMTGLLTLSGDPTAALHTATKQYADARGMDAMSYSGMQINGGMEVSQELGATGGAVNNQGRFIVDGWTVLTNGVQNLNFAQNTNCPPGFRSSALVAVTVANTAPAAADYVVIRHAIEGYRIVRLAWGGANAKPVTLSFWVRTNRAGTYSGSVAGTNRSYPFPFTINAAGTWEYKTITIPGCTDGTWSSDHTVGLYLNFSMMLGTGGTGPANAWGTGGNGVPGTTNGVAATSDGFWLTGVTLLQGTQAPTAAQSPQLVRPFDQELMTCKRYYHRITTMSPWLWAPATPNVVIMGISIPEMRVTPTCTLNGVSYGSNATAAAFNAINTNSVCVQWSGTVSGMSLISWTTITCDARI